MLRYLFTTAAMISVPPVEPLCRKTTASEVPVKLQPMTNDIKSWPGPNICSRCPAASVIAFCASVSNRDRAKMA